MNNQVPFIAEDLGKVYDVYHFRILSYLGVNSIPVEKKERLLVDEIGANNEERSYMKDARLEQRKIATDELKRVFNLSVSVDYREVKQNEPDNMFGTWKAGGEGGNSPKGNEGN